MNATVTPKNHRGVIVPMVTPVTDGWTLDEAAVARIVDHLVAGGVHGVFVLGTTGEGTSVPLEMREQVVRWTVKCAQKRLLVYAGICTDSLAESIAAGNRYFAAGVDAVVAHVPACFEAHPKEALNFFTELASQLEGDLILYNMPLTTNVSLPIEVCKESARRPRVIGIKDSENNAERLDELLRELGGKETFSVFVGTGPLMAVGLLQGADGIVPSAGNLVPTLCRQLYDSALAGDRSQTELLHGRLMEISSVYQKGRTLGQSLSALKGAMTCLGLCGLGVFAPLQPIEDPEKLALRTELIRLGVPVRDVHPNEDQTSSWTDHGRSGGSRPRALPADPRQS
jgi:4-hydroxy-tetrahydrodipicolinate synthase